MKLDPRIQRLLLLLVVMAALWALRDEQGGTLTDRSTGSGAGRIERAFADQVSDVQVSGEGIVERVLPDDNKGSRHQKFILRLPSGHSLLVAHNIDLAQRLPGLSPGDSVSFNGEYEWNPRGGVLHWTHRDPAGRHEDGWLRYRGVTYQ